MSVTYHPSSRTGWILRAKTTGYGKMILTVLAHHANGESLDCWPSRRRIVEESGFSEATVKRTLRKLEAEGFIRRGPVQDANGRAHEHGFTLLMDTLTGEKAMPKPRPQRRAKVTPRTFETLRTWVDEDAADTARVVNGDESGGVSQTQGGVSQTRQGGVSQTPPSEQVTSFNRSVEQVAAEGPLKGTVPKGPFPTRIGPARPMTAAETQDRKKLLQEQSRLLAERATG